MATSAIDGHLLAQGSHDINETDIHNIAAEEVRAIEINLEETARKAGLNTEQIESLVTEVIKNIQEKIQYERTRPQRSKLEKEREQGLILISNCIDECNLREDKVYNIDPILFYRAHKNISREAITKATLEQDVQALTQEAVKIDLDILAQAIKGVIEFEAEYYNPFFAILSYQYNDDLGRAKLSLFEEKRDEMNRLLEEKPELIAFQDRFRESYLEMNPWARK